MLTCILTLPVSAQISEKCQEAIRAPDDGKFEFAKAIATECLLEANSNAQYRALLLVARGRGHHGLGEDIEAVEDFSAAVELTPDDLFIWWLRARSQLVIEKFQDCVDGMSEVLPQISPRDVPLMSVTRALCHSGLANYDLAIEDSTIAIRMNPDFAEAYFVRGSAFSETSNDRRSLEDFGKAVSLAPEELDYRWAKAEKLLEMLQLDQAIDELTYVIQLNPEDSLAYYTRGTAHSLFGDRELAIADFETVLKIDSESEVADRAREDLAELAFD